ncbi:MAG: prolipoprotein diacylglyceryl transferase [Magnetovibrionaceae bacterium]
MFAIAFPVIDPIAVQLGPVAIRWYALAYLAGLVLGWWLMRKTCLQEPETCKVSDVDDYLVWATIGVVLGGRIGYVLFYNLPFYLDNPGAILQVWKGGMAFHGGLLGVVLATWLFSRRREISFIRFCDLLAISAPIGLFFGRIANFVNAELWGRVTDVPWGVVFPNGGPLARHPSQLYEALLEGVALFVIMLVLRGLPWVRARPGLLAGVFLIGYWAARSFVELFREPDAHIGFLVGGITMGQVLSLPMLLAGLWFVGRAWSKPTGKKPI